MAMVTVVRDGKQLKIPFGAFKNSYESAGWKIAESENVTHLSNAKNANGERKSSPKATSVKNEWDKADEELEYEKSIDEMDMNELKNFAKSKGININDLRTVGALKKAIKAVM